MNVQDATANRAVCLYTSDIGLAFCSHTVLFSSTYSVQGIPLVVLRVADTSAGPAEDPIPTAFHAAARLLVCKRQFVKIPLGISTPVFFAQLGVQLNLSAPSVWQFASGNGSANAWGQTRSYAIVPTGVCCCSATRSGQFGACLQRITIAARHSQFSNVLPGQPPIAARHSQFSNVLPGQPPKAARLEGTSGSLWLVGMSKRGAADVNDCELLRRLADSEPAA